MKSFISASALAGATLLVTAPSLATQNEISVQYDDIDPADNATSVTYTRYLSELDASKGALSINPYLQRVSSVSADYSTYRSTDGYSLQGTWYINQRWALDAGVARSENRAYRTEIEQRSVFVTGGYNVNPNLQFGAGVNYERTDIDRDFSGTNLGEYYLASSSDEDYVSMVYSRYTQIQNGEGWDLRLSATFDDDTAVAVSGRYFFNKGLSVGGDINDVDGYRTLSLSTEYWATDQFSLSVGASTNLNGDYDTNTLTAGASYRF